jgi:hypothetical protein
MSLLDYDNLKNKTRRRRRTTTTTTTKRRSEVVFRIGHNRWLLLRPVLFFIPSFAVVLAAPLLSQKELTSVTHRLSCGGQVRRVLGVGRIFY